MSQVYKEAMPRAVLCLLALVALSPRVSARLDSLTTVEEYMNICLDGKNHKPKPGPEDELLSNFCSPWAKKACCTPETTEGIHINPKWLNFNWDHCKVLSSQCREYFIMDLCFYECSPNVGPWLVKDSKKFRKERFLNVPLCKSECSRWWEACQNDFTCLRNWAVGFNWSSGINTCPEKSECKPFHAMYSSSEDFCENLMGGSFKVTPDTQECFYLWFDPNLPNPNERVARKRASEILGVPYVESDGQQGSRSSSSFLAQNISVVFCIIISVFILS